MTINPMSAFPKTYTDLFLRPAKEIFDRMSVVEQFPFEYDLSIPVSPSVLNYKRDADHNEVYSIVKGGMLERNLPKLWRVSVETYLPREAWERAFHNRRMVKRSKKTNDTNFLKQEYHAQDAIDEKSGRVESCKYQQMFVDYINRLMDWKVPCQLWDESNPVRIKHQPLYFCIEHFDYKMLPHDDIDYTLDLVEWKEPKVIVGEIVSSEDKEEEPKPKVQGASGNAIMAFGYMDRRNHKDGRVYSADTIGAKISADGSSMCTLSKIPNGWSGQLTVLSEIIQGYNMSVQSGGTIFLPQRQWGYFSDYITMEYVLMHRISTQQSVLPPASDTYSAFEAVYPKEMKEITRNVQAFSTNQTNRASKDFVSVDSQERTKNNTDTQVRTLSGGSLNKTLQNDMWAKKIKTLKNVPYFCIEFKPEKPTREMRYKVEDNFITTRMVGVWKVKRNTWYKTMYVLKPIAGKDKVYDPTFTYLCPLENTIVTPYQRYLNTFDAQFSNKSGTDIDNKARKDGNNQYFASRDNDKKVTNNVEPDVVTLKTGQKTLASEVRKRGGDEK